MKFKYQFFRNAAIVFAIIAIAFTIVVACVDRQQIGPDGTSVGLAAINGSFAQGVGVNLTYDKLSDVVLACSLLNAAAFAIIGLVQLIKRKSIKKVNKELLAMGCLYIVMAIIYVLFDKLFVINLRPVLLEGEKELESSFPSSHMLVITVVAGAAMFSWKRVLEDKRVIGIIIGFLNLFVVVAGIYFRLESGVHWLTDILGGLIYGITLLYAYAAVVLYLEEKENNQ